MMFGPFKRRRVLRVVVAVVYDPERQKFLVVFSPRWRGYSFPVRRFRRGGASDPLRERDHAVQEARAALLSELGPSLGEAADAHWMDRIEVPGVSERSGEETLYRYEIVTLVPVNPLPNGPFAHRFGFLSAQEIRDSDPDELGPSARVVTWTTWQVLTRLLDAQRVAAAVVSRISNAQREYLMTLNRHGKWFFPARRMDDPGTAEQLVVYEFKIEADYLGRIEVTEGPTVEMEQNTLHLGPRSYTFHLRKAYFPQEDLTLPGNHLEAALFKAGIPFRWVKEGDMEAPAVEISPTVEGLYAAVMSMER
jgi:hypothetical protein